MVNPALNKDMNFRGCSKGALTSLGGGGPLEDIGQVTFIKFNITGSLTVPLAHRLQYPKLRSLQCLNSALIISQSFGSIEHAETTYISHIYYISTTETHKHTHYIYTRSQPLRHVKIHITYTLDLNH